MDAALNIAAAHVVRRVADQLIRETWDAEAPLIRLAEARERAGRREKEGAPDDWAGWDEDRFHHEIREELADAFVYAREALRRGMQP